MKAVCAAPNQRGDLPCVEAQIRRDGRQRSPSAEGAGRGMQSAEARPSRSRVESRRVRKEVLEVSGKHPRYGYRRITALLRRESFEINAMRIARIRREEGLKVSKKQRRIKRLRISTAERLKAERPRQVWSWDFGADQTENGSNFRILTLIDEHTRECLATHAAWSIRCG